MTEWAFDIDQRVSVYAAESGEYIQKARITGLLAAEDKTPCYEVDFEDGTGSAVLPEMELGEPY